MRLGILWRGAPEAGAPAEDRGLAPLFAALAARSVEVVPLPFGDDRVAETRARLNGLDGLLVWVNPIQDGANRAQLDELLREASDSGTWVSAHPDVVARIGTKEVLFRTRHLGWGSDTELYRSIDDLTTRLPPRLARHRRLVLKQGRGNGGNGVWGLTLASEPAPVALATRVQVREAHRRNGESEELLLGDFLERAAACLAWSGFLVDQPYQDRLAEGMVRCYLSHGEVVGFCRQWPKGLLSPVEATAPTPEPVMLDRDVADYQALRAKVERDWVPELARLVGLDQGALPVIWDADFLYGEPEPTGEPTYVLCEINASAVWPFPPTAAPTIAANTVCALGGS
jgi:hypothetical protein